MCRLCDDIAAGIRPADEADVCADAERGERGIPGVHAGEDVNSLGDAGADTREDFWGGGNLQDSRQLDAEGIERNPRRYRPGKG